jgi:hypothetical protein
LQNCELLMLAVGLHDARVAADGSYSAAIGADAAMRVLSSTLKVRSPIPGLKVSDAAGSLQIWIHDGLPSRYELATAGFVALPTGRKELIRVAKVAITTVDREVQD